ncbi:MAG: Asp-tRNA(Asn)/Glu-tRNA(Gln) amidotransferase subunit GatC [Polyangiales bacterium]
MARLTLDQVRHVAQLAALELSEAEAQAMQEDLGSILDYIAALEAVDVSGVEAVFHPSQVASPLRPDEVRGSLSRQSALEAAPESDQGGFAVPRVLDGDA